MHMGRLKFGFHHPASHAPAPQSQSAPAPSPTPHPTQTPDHAVVAAMQGTKAALEAKQAAAGTPVCQHAFLLPPCFPRTCTTMSERSSTLHSCLHTSRLRSKGVSIKPSSSSSSANCLRGTQAKEQKGTIRPCCSRPSSAKLGLRPPAVGFNQLSCVAPAAGGRPLEEIAVERCTIADRANTGHGLHPCTLARMHTHHTATTWHDSMWSKRDYS
jgi:hypothetical protein